MLPSSEFESTGWFCCRVTYFRNRLCGVYTVYHISPQFPMKNYQGFVIGALLNVQLGDKLGFGKVGSPSKPLALVYRMYLIHITQAIVLGMYIHSQVSHVKLNVLSTS